jgi:hypothetical protein
MILGGVPPTMRYPHMIPAMHFSDREKGRRHHHEGSDSMVTDHETSCLASHTLVTQRSPEVT